jgi:hypothetical protein
MDLFWKLKRQFGIGSEARIAQDKVTLDRCAAEFIAHRRRDIKVRMRPEDRASVARQSELIDCL